MERGRQRQRTIGQYYGRQRMSMSLAARYANIFEGAAATGRASYRAGRLRSGVVARRARAMLDRRTAGFLGVERKFYDTSLSATLIVAPTDAAGAELDPSSTSMISTPAQGDGEQNRDGKRILIDQVQIKGTVAFTALADQTAGPTDKIVFIALVLDTQSNGAQMNSEDCFKNTNAAALTATAPMRNLLFGNRFRVLKTWILQSDYKPAYDGTNIEVGGNHVPFEGLVPFPAGLPVNFNAGTTASIANVIDNSIHVIAYGTGSAATLSYNARIRFRG